VEAHFIEEELMKKIRMFALIIMLAYLALGADSCSSGCTKCGYEPGEHLTAEYINKDGQTVYLSGYADGNGCIAVEDCQAIE
jgi:hypothetical protein